MAKLARFDYRTALRAKGIRPIPPADELRSSLAEGELDGHIVGSQRKTA